MQAESPIHPSVESDLQFLYGCFKSRPSQNVRFLIHRNLQKLISITIKDATQFSTVNATKIKALYELKFTLLIAEQSITPHTERVLKSLIKIRQLDLENIETLVNNIAETIGCFVKSEYYIPLMIEMFQNEEVKGNTKNTIILLNLVSFLLRSIKETDEHVKSLITLMHHYERVFYDNDEGLIAIFNIVEILIQKANKFEHSEVISIMFSISLNVKSTKTIPESHRSRVDPIVETLARKSGHPSAVQLYAHQINPILEKIIDQKEYVQWTKTSKDRFKFDTIVRSCYGEVKRYLPQILQIIEFLINPQSDLETRMDTLVLLEFMINLEDLKEALSAVSEQIMKKILIVSIQWKVGKPQIKIRKAGVINMIALIENQIISAETLLDCYEELLPPLKNCLNDDWAPELRLASCELVEKVLLCARYKIDAEQLREMYPLLLQRLDDSQNPIRKKITIAINLFFSCQDIKLSESTFDYMIGAIFIHFDDESEQIREAIFVSLRFAAGVNHVKVLSAAKQNLKKMKHKASCQQLIEHCEELAEESND